MKSPDGPSIVHCTSCATLELVGDPFRPVQLRASRVPKRALACAVAGAIDAAQKMPAKPAATIAALLHVICDFL
jgi:hypothetical protein